MQLFKVFEHRPKALGLALGGGAVRGAAHIGVLQVLEREGIVPDIVVGTSVGAAIGAAYAAGVSTSEISRLFHTARWHRLARLAWPNRLSLLDTAPLEALIQASIGVPMFEQLPRCFAAVACDILTGERVVLQTGLLARAVCASAAIPGLFPPVELDDRLLVDGGVVDNLPVDVARELGADYVIAVDLFPPPTGKQRPANLFEVLIGAGALWSRANHPDPATIECYILPDIGDYLLWDFNAVPELEAHGRAAAEQVIVRLKADLGLDRRPRRQIAEATP
jgi:NTE family protein